ncbi:MAG: hypothetical protein EOP23_21195 [Hyphomicrobiales bacterium]|nr:MAG: hypothetical protein EOP23_21195 [Hyphomicrobiales bacterium]
MVDRIVETSAAVAPPRRFLATADAWFGYAEQAIAHLEASGGAREEAYRAFALRLDGKMQVVQRLVRAARFVREVEVKDDPELGRDLRRAPIDAVLALAGWARRDRESALAAATRLVAGDIALSGLRELERTSRRTGRRAPDGTASDAEWQAFVSRAAARLVGDRFPGATPIWAAKGWSVGPRTRLKLPGPLGALKRTPLLHLAFEIEGDVLLVSTSATRIAAPRRSTLTTQTLIALMGYCSLGYRALYCSNHAAECESARELLDALRAAGQHPALEVAQLEMGSHRSRP